MLTISLGAVNSWIFVEYWKIDDKYWWCGLRWNLPLHIWNNVQVWGTLFEKLILSKRGGFFIKYFWGR